MCFLPSDIEYIFCIQSYFIILKSIANQCIEDCIAICNATPRDDAANRAALAALRSVLASHARVHEAVGADAGLTWHEPSLLAIGLPLDLADREARRHAQNAIVTVRAGEPARLRMYRPDWRAAVEAANLDMRFVDWVASPAPA